MIDVPVEVKDALREGTYKKNYRFVLGEEAWHEVGSIKTIGWYSPSTNYGDDEKYTIRDSKTYKFIVDDAEHDTYTLYVYKSNDPNWRTVASTSRNTWDVTIWDSDSAYVEIKSTSGNLVSNVSVQNYYNAEIIDNDNLIAESVNIDERMCSGDTIKFGLCEGSSLEFQYFNYPNITGQRIQAFVDIETEAKEFVKVRELVKTGRATLKENGKYKITATAANMANIFYLLWSHGTVTDRLYFTVALDGHGEVEIPNAKKNDILRLDVRSGTSPVAEVFQERNAWHTIPMGFFDVKKCSRQASTGIIKATCYNKLQSEYLDAKANDDVAELVAQGEYGYTDQISLYTLLKTLLNGYGIEEAVYGYTQLIYSATRSYNLNSIPLYYSDGTPTGSTLYLYNLALSMNLSADDFYKFYLYTEEMFDNARTKVWWSYRANYTKINGALYTIDQVALGSWTSTKYLTGNIYLRRKVDENTFFFNVEGGMADAETAVYSKCLSIDVSIPVYAVAQTTAPSINPSTWDSYFNQKWGADYKFLDAYKQDLSNAEKMRLTTSEIESIQDVTLRELQTAVYETSCQFGQLSRETDLFSGVELNHSRLYPTDSLYPATDLYPSGAVASGFKSMYSKLWADEGNIHKWRYLIITYKGLDGEGNEVEKTLQRTVNADGTDNYNCSDNWLFRNLVWAAEDVGAYADAMAAKMRNITWFPFEMWAAGLPYLETGDEIEIPLGENTYTSYILQRQLKGIQNLQDTYINGTLDIF